MYYALTGLAILMLSSLGSLLIVNRNTSEQPKTVKAVLFGLYFWGLVFLQLLIGSLIYTLMK
ncbi:MAG: hypothetical protein HOP23_03715 [Methylococcaceae bacterium]|nr:hypothetical protein [Methylococcaceae bacterium]